MATSRSRSQDGHANGPRLAPREGRPDLDPPQLLHIAVRRSVRWSGDTRTRRSRRTLALPARCVEVLRQRFEDQGWDRLAADEKWEEHGLDFSSAVGKPLDAANVRRAFRQALKDVDGVDAAEWTPRELRHGFVSLLSDRGVPSRRSPDSSGTPGRLSPRRSTGSRSGP